MLTHISKEIHFEVDLRERLSGELLIHGLACGLQSGHFILGNGELHSFGIGTSGVIGHGDITYRCKNLTQARIGGIYDDHSNCRRYKMISVNQNHAVAIT